MKQLKRITGLSFIAGALSLCMISIVSANPAAVELVKKTTDEIQSKLKAEQAAIKKDPSLVIKYVNDIVLPNFDFTKMSSVVLGKHWKDATKEQQEKFTDQFSMLLVRTYSKALEDNADRKIDFLPVTDKPDAEKVTVRTEVQQDAGFPIPISYKMHKVDGKWKVYDVVIDSISLVVNYRSSFSKEIKASGIDSLIASLAERNTKPDKN